MGHPLKPNEADPSGAGPLRLLVVLWVVITVWLMFEYARLNGWTPTGGNLGERIAQVPSVLKWLHQKGIFGTKTETLTPHPGDPLSWRMGWTGFTMICLTNLYVWKRRQSVGGQKANLTWWLDTHIFLGLMGPTLILFHCNFKVRGLVSISFWSMVIVFVSGVVGRYFYVQLLRDRAFLRSAMKAYEKGMAEMLRGMGGAVDPRQIRVAQGHVLAFAGATPAMLEGKLTTLEVLLMSLAGDIRLVFGAPALPAGVPPIFRRPLIEYSLVTRRFYAGKYFRKLMGYWHTLHRPFAIFMYAVSVIHIVSAYVFRV